MNFRQEFEVDLIKSLLIQAASMPPPVIERRAYYDEQGHIITYTCENLPGNYINVTPEQFAEARPDAIVRDGKLVYTHRLSHVVKLVQSSSGRATSKYDINILVPDTDPEACFWSTQVREIINE